MKRLFGTLLVCGFLAASIASAAVPVTVTHPRPNQKAAHKKARKAKKAKGRKAAARKASPKKVAG